MFPAKDTVKKCTTPSKFDCSVRYSDSDLKIVLPNQKDKRKWLYSNVEYTDDSLIIGGFQVMQTWEEPIMDLLAKEVTTIGGDVLEIGFGLGLSASKVLYYGCNHLTLIEAHPVVIGKAKQWKKAMEIKYPHIRITIIEGFWQDRISEIDKKFDGILFDASPISGIERNHGWFFSFFEEVPRLLKEGGTFTYYSNETKDFNRRHKRVLNQIFPEEEFTIKFRSIENLKPSNCLECTPFLGQ